MTPARPARLGRPASPTPTAMATSDQTTSASSPHEQTSRTGSALFWVALLLSVRPDCESLALVHCHTSLHAVGAPVPCPCRPATALQLPCVAHPTPNVCLQRYSIYCSNLVLPNPATDCCRVVRYVHYPCAGRERSTALPAWGHLTLPAASTAQATQPHETCTQRVLFRTLGQDVILWVIRTNSTTAVHVLLLSYAVRHSSAFGLPCPGVFSRR